MGAAEEKGRFSDTTTGCSTYETSSLFTACWQPRSSERQPIWVQDKHLFPIKHLVVNHGHTRRCSRAAFQKKYLKLIIPSTSPETSVQIQLLAVNSVYLQGRPVWIRLFPGQEDSVPQTFPIDLWHGVLPSWCLISLFQVSMMILNRLFFSPAETMKPKLAVKKAGQQGGKLFANSKTRQLVLCAPLMCWSHLDQGKSEHFQHCFPAVSPHFYQSYCFTTRAQAEDSVKVI